MRHSIVNIMVAVLLMGISRLAIAEQSDETGGDPAQESTGSEQSAEASSDEAEVAPDATPASDVAAPNSEANRGLTGLVQPPDPEDDGKYPVIYVEKEENGRRVLVADKTYLEKQKAIFGGASFGYEIGYWGTSSSFGFRSDIAFDKNKLMGLRLRLFTALGPKIDTADNAFDPIIILGIQYFIRTPIYFGVIRTYAGGGFTFGYRPITYPMPDDPLAIADGAHVDTKEICENSFLDPEGCRWGMAGGGGVGVEFLVHKSHSIIIDIGGQGPVHVHKHDGTFHALFAHMWYFGKYPE